jgi:hypothetical protein
LIFDFYNFCFVEFEVLKVVKEIGRAPAPIAMWRKKWIKMERLKQYERAWALYVSTERWSRSVEELGDPITDHKGANTTYNLEQHQHSSDISFAKRSS